MWLAVRNIPSKRVPLNASFEVALQGLQAVANWTPPSGGMVSAVSLSWGMDEAKWAQSDIATTETALKVSGAQLHSVCR